MAQTRRTGGGGGIEAHEARAPGGVPCNEARSFCETLVYRSAASSDPRLPFLFQKKKKKAS